MPNFIDLTGQKFGRWVVLERAENDRNKNTRWLCRCKCSKERIVQGDHLKSGASTSCGCFRSEFTQKRSKTHGISKSPLYSCWIHMWQRCTNPRDKSYINYGGRGIKIDSKWQDFEPFRDWALSHGYSNDLTIDRINVNGDYTPSNCQWTNRLEQNRNQRVRSDNTSGCRGVCWDKRSNKWHVTISINGKSKHIKYCVDINDAIIARKNAELKYWKKEKSD